MPTIIGSQFKGPSNTNDGSMVAVEIEDIQSVSGPMEAKDGRGVHSQFAGEGKLIPVCFQQNQRVGESVMYDGSDTHPTLTVNNANGAQRMPDKENFNGIVQCFTKGAHPMNAEQPQTYEHADTAKTLNCFNISEARAEEVVVNFKADLAGGDTETAMVTGDHDSRSTDFTNLITEKKMSEKSNNPVAVLDMQGGRIGANYQMPPETTPAITRGRGIADDVHSVAYKYAVRRITPVEGERLQGFADGWTRPCFKSEDITDELIDRFIEIHRNWAVINGTPDAKPKSRKFIREWLEKISSEDCPDGPRYKAIGNSMSTNVMQWIGLRIQDEENRERETRVAAS